MRSRSAPCTGFVRRDPQVPGGECRAATDGRRSIRQQGWRRPRYKLVCDGLSERVANVRVHDPPRPAPRWVNQSLRVTLVLESRCVRPEGVAHRVLVAGGVSDDIYLVDLVAGAVDVHGEPQAAQMFMVRCRQPWSDDSAV